MNEKGERDDKQEGGEKMQEMWTEWDTKEGRKGVKENNERVR